MRAALLPDLASPIKKSRSDGLTLAAAFKAFDDHWRKQVNATHDKGREQCLKDLLGEHRLSAPLSAPAQPGMSLVSAMHEYPMFRDLYEHCDLLPPQGLQFASIRYMAAVFELMRLSIAFVEEPSAHLQLYPWPPDSRTDVLCIQRHPERLWYVCAARERPDRSVAMTVMTEAAVVALDGRLQEDCQARPRWVSPPADLLPAPYPVPAVWSSPGAGSERAEPPIFATNARATPDGPQPRLPAGPLDGQAVTTLFQGFQPFISSTVEAFISETTLKWKHARQQGTVVVLYKSPNWQTNGANGLNPGLPTPLAAVVSPLLSLAVHRQPPLSPGARYVWRMDCVPMCADARGIDHLDRPQQSVQRRHRRVPRPRCFDDTREQTGGGSVKAQGPQSRL